MTLVTKAMAPCAAAVRSQLRQRAGTLCQVQSLSSLIIREQTASATTRIVGNPESVDSAGATCASGSTTIRSLGFPPLPALVNRRNLSTAGKGNAGPGENKGYGRRQKPADSGNTALGKGFDLMTDDPGSRQKILIGGYDPHGFQLGDGVDVRGSMICLPNSYVLWEPRRSADITIESLRLVELITPKIGEEAIVAGIFRVQHDAKRAVLPATFGDLLLIGVGETMTERLKPELLKHLAGKGIRVEQMDTVNACSTFNVLNAEDRRVAAALIQLSEDEGDKSR